MGDLTAIILAAGEGTRMKSDMPKVLHKIAGRPMLMYVIEAARSAGAGRCIVVVGHKACQVKSYLSELGVEFAVQSSQLGTGHAVMQAQPLLEEYSGDVLVLCGDTPLITGETLKCLIDYHRANDLAATVLAARLPEPSGYGRIIRNDAGELEHILEEKDATPEERRINEVNSGMYCFKAPLLFSALMQIDNNNAKQEYYLTDCIKVLKAQGLKVGAVTAGDPGEIAGVNDRVQLAAAAGTMRRRILTELMQSGVTVIDPGSTYVDAGVEVGRDTIIYPMTILEKGTRIGEKCVIGPGCTITDSVIGSGVVIRNSVVQNSVILDNTTIGPFANIRPDSRIGPDAKIGDFVEVKKTVVGKGSKVPHLAYVGDGVIGSGVNIGAGVIFVNYDGRDKHVTTVEDGAFVGCNANLVAPVKVGSKAYIAAGSTITDEVPAESLAIARSRQVVKKGWRKRKTESQKVQEAVKDE